MKPLLLFIAMGCCAGFFQAFGEAGNGVTSKEEILAHPNAFPSPGADRANAPVYMCGDAWCVRIPATAPEEVVLRYVPEPAMVTVLGTGAVIAHRYHEGMLAVPLTDALRKDADAVLAIHWKPSQWEPAIRAFEEQDRKTEPARNSILFVGSSTIRIWDVNRCFPDKPVINRGFGGSQYGDAAQFVPRIVTPYGPKLIVAYSGDNDIAAGHGPDWVLADVKAFVSAVRHDLPKTPIILLSIKPSRARWKLRDKGIEANRLIQAFAAGQEQVRFLDLTPALLTAEGQPRDDLLQKDGLHLNESGYDVIANLLRPLLP
jgi:lysophospholipase L1-like esterase